MLSADGGRAGTDYGRVMSTIVPFRLAAIEAHTRDLLAALETHLATHPYLLGGRPSLGDCALMGPL